MLQFGITHRYWLSNRHGLEILLKASPDYQVLLAHIDLLICIEQLQTYIFIHYIIVGEHLIIIYSGLYISKKCFQACNWGT